MRLMGKRQIGEFQPFEFAIAVMVSELAALPLTQADRNIWHAIIPIFILVICQFLFSLASVKSITIRAIMCGRPRIVIKHGQLQEKNLRKEIYTINDLLEQLRILNVQNISDVEYGILETNGQLSIILKSQKRPVTPSDLGIDTKYEGITLDLIIDGVILDHNLELAKLDTNWLIDQLSQKGYPNPKDIFYAYLDTQGNFFSQPKLKACKNQVVDES